jgi:hypothetical protein
MDAIIDGRYIAVKSLTTKAAVKARGNIEIENGIEWKLIPNQLFEAHHLLIAQQH